MMVFIFLCLSMEGDLSLASNKAFYLRLHEVGIVPVTARSCARRPQSELSICGPWFVPERTSRSL